MAGKKTSLDEQVNKYAPLVKRIAYHMMARLPASVEVDDLIQVGLIGLMDAVSRFDGTQGAQFESYATQRIRGSMLDELREADETAREVVRKIWAETFLPRRTPPPPFSEAFAAICQDERFGPALWDEEEDA